MYYLVGIDLLFFFLLVLSAVFFHQVSLLLQMFHVLRGNFLHQVALLTQLKFKSNFCLVSIAFVIINGVRRNQKITSYRRMLVVTELVVSGTQYPGIRPQKVLKSTC